MGVWAAARAREHALETENASVILATRAVCARAVLTATSERKAPMTA